MANIMQQVKLKNHTSRDGFDLSHKNAFTAKVGELLPVTCMEIIPGDYVEAKVQHFTRTMPVNTAAYTRIREYYDWFFVPTELLWNKFNTFVTQMTDNNQHATGINSRQVLTDTHPYFTTNQLHGYMQKLVSGVNASNRNIFKYDRALLTNKLLSYLDYGDFTPSTTTQSSFPYRENVNLNPFPLLAYQKIYSDFYRNSQWEKAYAPSFNIDYISGAASSLNIPVSDINAFANGGENMFDLRYCNWHKDLFMGLLPNSQYGDAASVIADVNFGNLVGNPSYETRLSGTGYTQNVNKPQSISVKANTVSQYSGFYWHPEGATDSSNDPVVLALDVNALQNLRVSLGLTSEYGANAYTTFSILALRQAEALQKWREVTQSQQQDYKSQVEAHFGVSPDNGYSDRSRWIGGSDSTLDISEVVNQNITSDNAALLAGKGVGVGEGKIKFKSEVHGYLMCIYHAVPLLDYSFTGVNRTNLKTKVTDYAIPEFDRTGMVSVPLIELSNTSLTQGTIPSLLGYAPRYYDYKQAVDVVHGAFKSTLFEWIAPFSDAYISNYLNEVGRSSLDYVFFKVNPSTMNPIFAINADANVNTDQLLVNSAFSVNAVRNLDRNGLPY